MEAISTAAPGLDLDSIQDAQSADIELKHPVTGLGTGAFFTLAGPEHPDRKKVTLDVMRRARAEIQRGKRGSSDPEDDLNEGRQMLAKVTLGWRGVSKAGKPLEFSAQAAQELYSDPKSQWIVRQLMAAMNDMELFIKA